MIIKGYKRKGTGFAGQDQESWTGVWGSVQDLKKSFDNADSDYLAPFFRKFFPRPPGKILEGGCGIGKYVAAYKRLGYDIRGVDFSADTIRRVKDFDPSLPIEEGNIEALPYDDNTFDCYYSGGVIEHFEEGPDGPLREARRVLRNGGVLLATVPYVNLLRRMYFSTGLQRRDKNLLLQRCDACAVDAVGPEGFLFSEYSFDVASARPFFERHGFGIEESIPTDFLWGELGLFLVSTARLLTGQTWDRKKSLYDQPSAGVFGGTQAGLRRSWLYDFLVTEDWAAHPEFRLPLRTLNYLSGHMVMLVARAV